MPSPDQLHPLDRAVLTAALDAPGTHGAVADIARAILDGHLTTRDAARSSVAAVLADPDRFAEAQRVAAEDPEVAEQVWRLRDADWSAL